MYVSLYLKTSLYLSIDEAPFVALIKNAERKEAGETEAAARENIKLRTNQMNS